MTQERIRRPYDDGRDSSPASAVDSAKPNWETFERPRYLDDILILFFGGAWFPLTSFKQYIGYTDWHHVFVSPFYIASRAVKIGEWKRVMGSYDTQRNWQDDDSGIRVSWNDAVRFCNELSSLEKLQPCYTFARGRIKCDFNANGYRLPTEAEFNYATPFYRYRFKERPKKILINPRKAIRDLPESPYYHPSGDKLVLSEYPTWVWDIIDEDYRLHDPIDPAGADKGKLRVKREFPMPCCPSNNVRKHYRYGEETEYICQFYLTRSWMVETGVREHNLARLIPQWDRQLRDRL